ncbi:MAG: hypothetical protein KDC99_19530, partial [Cyclobacteriaceae bacterium]|nr:hypothetical protein [Cyclobacteriaceae bacterium]
MKYISSLFLMIGQLLLISSVSHSQSRSSLAAPNIETFAVNSDLLGVASNSVNLFSGDVVLPLPLVKLSGRNGLDFSLSATYNSNIQNQKSDWNLDAPTGTLGLGWSMSV